MSWRSGLGTVDVAALDVLRRIGAKADRPRVKTARAVDALDAEMGLGPDLSYELLLSLGRTWLLPLPLVDFQGAMGSANDEPPAPRYNEIRLSTVGQLVAKVERTHAGAVPIGLINGDTHRGGSRPPFRPDAIVAALRRLQTDKDVTDAELIDIVGPPLFLGGCELDGDLHALMAGEAGRFQLRARIAVPAGSRLIKMVTSLPASAPARSSKPSRPCRPARTGKTATLSSPPAPTSRCNPSRTGVAATRR